VPTKKELELAIGILQAALKEQEPATVPKKRGRKPRVEQPLVIATPEQTEVVAKTAAHRDDPSTYLMPIKKNGNTSNKRTTVGADPNNQSKPCKLVPFEVKPRNNTFVDDGIEYKEDTIKTQLAISKGEGGKGSRNISVRDKQEKQMIKVQCPSCDSIREVDSRTIRTFGNTIPLIRCDKCIMQR
jgi:hypothetical protein